MTSPRTARKTAGSYCQTCVRIRLFLAVAGLLIVALPFMGDRAAALSHLTPMGVALAFMAIGSVAFILRWIAWQRSKSRDEMPTEQDPDLSA